MGFGASGAFLSGVIPRFQFKGLHVQYLAGTSKASIGARVVLFSILGNQ